MSEQTSSRPVRPSSQPLVWILGLLSLLLLGIVTAAAVSHNPLYSDRDAYGVSTYHFIEQCKEEMQRPENVKVGPVFPGQPDQRKSLPEYLRSNPQQQLPAGADIFLRPGNSSALVGGIQHPSAGAIQLKTPASVGYHLGGQEYLVAQAPVTCDYNAQTRRAEVSIQ